MYFPNLKTSDSELRAITQLDNSIKKKITPVFELTRSRKTSLSPNGSLERRFEQLRSALGDHPYILDLCTQDELMNRQTVALFDETGGYARWLKFLADNAGNKVIPCALYIEDGSKENFQRQAKSIVDRYGYICLRTSAADEVAIKLLNWLTDIVREDQIYVCAILYYIEYGQVNKHKKLAENYTNDVIGNKRPRSVIFPSSSFPRSVIDVPGCKDGEGAFEPSETTLNTWLKNKFPSLSINDSDFASVHPIRYPASGGSWIPRIDIFDGKSFHYVRTRREDGGYKDAASAIKQLWVDQIPECWGRRQIEKARAGVVEGKSPSFWISVRINCWITNSALKG